MTIYENPSRELWKELFRRPVAEDESLSGRVGVIIERVRRGGDAALRELALEIDKCPLESLEVSEDEFCEAEKSVSGDVKRAIAAASANIEAFHRAQMPRPVEVETAPGVRCFQKPVPIGCVGLYIPGGTAPLFSTVLMLALPAKVAGCGEVVLCTPCQPSGKVSAEVLYAARQCGVSRVFKAGGAQAVAAMALGTETIPKVDKIFGPGNRYVTCAKQMVSGKYVSIDMPAGPSEVMVLADDSADPAFVAADLLSQAEHGRDSQVMLVCRSKRFAEAVLGEVESQKKSLSRGEFVEGALSKSCAVVFSSADRAAAEADILAFSDGYAPEHLIIQMEEPWRIADRVRAAGSVFVGPYSPESAGDYASGTNHTLPTSGWARSCSGVNIESYIRRITYQELTREGLCALSDTVINMAEAEGLEAHANAVRTRL